MKVTLKAGTAYLPRFVAAVVIVASATIVCAAEPPQFTDVFGEPLDIKDLPGETITPAVEKFFETGQDPYVGDENVLAEGKKLYQTNCQNCHMPNGSGRMGPSLIGDAHRYDRFTTDKGLFEIIYGGATKPMLAYGHRLEKDKILKLMAYVRSLKKD